MWPVSFTGFSGTASSQSTIDGVSGGARLAYVSGAPVGVTPFQINTDADDAMALAGVGIDVISANETVLHFAYDGEFGETTQVHAVGLKGSARF